MDLRKLGVFCFLDGLNGPQVTQFAWLMLLSPGETRTPCAHALTRTIRQERHTYASCHSARMAAPSPMNAR